MSLDRAKRDIAAKLHDLGGDVESASSFDQLERLLEMLEMVIGELWSTFAIEAPAYAVAQSSYPEAGDAG